MLRKLVAVAVSAGFLGFAAPALAMSSSCWTDVWPAFKTDCRTAAIPSNRTGHFIKYGQAASVGVPWKFWLYDNTNGKLVRYVSGFTPHTGQASGLYATYWAYFTCAAGYTWISN